MNYDNLLTAKLMSGRVSKRYCNAPITLRYSVGLTAAEPSFNFRETEVDSGVVTSFAPFMQVLARKILDVFMLSEEQPILRGNNFNAKEEMQGSQVFKRELPAKLLYDTYNKMRVITGDN